MQEVFAGAWSVLWAEWAIRWSLILGLGGLPWLTFKALQLKRGGAWQPTGKFVLFRQTCAFGALALSVWSFQLAADTFVVESESLQDLQTKHCTAAAEQSGGTVSVRCVDGTEYTGVLTEAGGSAGQGQLYLLPKTGLPVYFKP